MPKAMESRNDVFITDHGSRCTSRSRARRVPVGRPEPASSGRGATWPRRRRRGPPDRSGRCRRPADVVVPRPAVACAAPTAPRCRRPRPLPRPARSADAWPGRRTRPGRAARTAGRRGASGVSSARAVSHQDSSGSTSVVVRPVDLDGRRHVHRRLSHPLANIHLTGLVSGATRLVPRPRRPPRPPRRSPGPARRCGRPRRRRRPP